MERSYYDASAPILGAADPLAVLGMLTVQLPFAVEARQREAWIYQIQHLQKIATSIPDSYFFLEFMIPRMGRRADVILLYKGLVF